MVLVEGPSVTPGRSLVVKTVGFRLGIWFQGPNKQKQQKQTTCLWKINQKEKPNNQENNHLFKVVGLVFQWDEPAFYGIMWLILSMWLQQIPVCFCPQFCWGWELGFSETRKFLLFWEHVFVFLFFVDFDFDKNGGWFFAPISYAEINSIFVHVLGKMRCASDLLALRLEQSFPQARL